MPVIGTVRGIWEAGRAACDAWDEGRYGAVAWHASTAALQVSSLKADAKLGLAKGKKVTRKVVKKPQKGTSKSKLGSFKHDPSGAGPSNAALHQKYKAELGKKVRHGGKVRANQKRTAEQQGKRRGAGKVWRGENKICVVSTAPKFSDHAIQRMAERGITPKMAQITVDKGLKFYDPLNKSINYILPNSFTSGKHLLIGVDPFTGEIKTVLRSSKNLIKPRMIPINFP